MQINTKSLLGHNKCFWGAVAWTVLVAVLCLLKSDTFQGAGFLDIPYKDKFVHFTFYFIFTLLWVNGLKKRFDSKNKVVLIVFCVAVLYGVIIEICQGLFTSSRSADLFDIIANTAGALTAVLFIHFFDRK